MKTPIVLIHSGANSSLESFYDGIKEMLNSKYHQSGNSFPTFTVSDAEKTEQAALSSHAAHAGDGVIVDGHMASLDGGRTWQPIERLIS